jgi:hypothetical protein
MKLYKNLPSVLFKTIIKRVKRGQGPDKNPIDVFDALPWDNTKKRIEDLPINTSIAEMWGCLFNNDEQTPLQRLILNTGHPVSRGKRNKCPKKNSASTRMTAATKLTSNARKWTKLAKL